MTKPLLDVQGVSKRFGGLAALADVHLQVQPGQIYGLIGPNGAGKTTFFNVITGLYQPDTGRFELNGRPYEPSSVHQVAQAGIARTFQNIRLFAEMSDDTFELTAGLRVSWAPSFEPRATRRWRPRLPSKLMIGCVMWALPIPPISWLGPCLMGISVA